MPVRPIQIASVVDQVHAALREQILSGELERGSRLPQETLAAELGVSRTPLREALRRLAGEGLVTLQPNHGATVAQVEPEHIFYLQARGIPRTEAQKLIVEGFFRPVIDRIPVEEIQGFLESAIARKVGL